MDFNAHCVLFSSEMVLPLLLISDKRNRIYPVLSVYQISESSNCTPRFLTTDLQNKDKFLILESFWE